MSHTYSEFLPSYSVGVDCYKAIPEIVKPYGKKAVAVGGKTAMEKSKKALLEGIKGSDIEIIDFVWYGGDRLCKRLIWCSVSEADELLTRQKPIVLYITNRCSHSRQLHQTVRHAPRFR